MFYSRVTSGTRKRLPGVLSFPAWRYLLLSPFGDYGVHMGTKTTLSEVTRRNILQGIVDKDTNKNATALKAGIAPTTFDRKLKNASTFTIEELGQIAEALDLKLTDIIGTGQAA